MRTKPLVGAAHINWSHPLAQGLVGCWLLNEGAGSIATNLVTGRPAALTELVWTVGKDGGALRSTSATPRIDTGETYNAQLNNPRGAVVWMIRPSFGVDGAQRFHWGHHNGTDLQPAFDAQIYADNNWYVGWASSGNDHRVVLAASSANLTQDVWQQYVLTWDLAGSRFYRNGLLIGSNGTAPLTTAPALTFFWAHSNGSTGNGLASGSVFSFGYLYGGRSLSTGDVLALHVNPQAFLARPRRQRGQRVTAAVEPVTVAPHYYQRRRALLAGAH